MCVEVHKYQTQWRLVSLLYLNVSTKYYARLKVHFPLVVLTGKQLYWWEAKNGTGRGFMNINSRVQQSMSPKSVRFWIVSLLPYRKTSFHRFWFCMRKSASDSRSHWWRLNFIFTEMFYQATNLASVQQPIASWWMFLAHKFTESPKILLGRESDVESQTLFCCGWLFSLRNNSCS